jgi:hypothetical protein
MQGGPFNFFGRRFEAGMVVEKPSASIRRPFRLEIFSAGGSDPSGTAKGVSSFRLQQ